MVRCFGTAYLPICGKHKLLLVLNLASLSTQTVFIIAETNLTSEPKTLGTFSTRVFSGNLKRQTGRDRVIRPCGHVRSSQRKEVSFHVSDLPERFLFRIGFLCHVEIRKLRKPVFLEQV